MTSSPNPISLVNFFVFNPTYGPKEGQEEQKILYYFPRDTDVDTKIKNVGLCEALIKFAETFSDQPCQSLHTQKHRQLFYNPEQDFWVVMTVSIPCSQKNKEGQVYFEYHDEDVQDCVFEAVLKQSYYMFRLFMGSFLCIVNKGNVNSLIQRLDHFFSRYLLTIKLNQCDILDIHSGISFLPLDKNMYLRTQCLINHLEADFPDIKYTAFLYNDQLVWSGLEQDDMRIMYRYLVTSLFPNYMDQEFHGSVTNRTSTVGAHYGKFMTGPPDLKNTTHLGKVPRVFVNIDTTHDECHLVVYRALSATICMLVDVSSTLTFDFFRAVDAFLGPQLSAVASDISEQYNKKTVPSLVEPSFKYVYFNHMNLAQKTTVHADIRKTSSVNIPKDILKLLGDMNTDLSKGTEDSEIIAKTFSDYWIVGKKSDQREFYVVINQKNANLIEINEEVKKLCATHFSNIFFLD